MEGEVTPLASLSLTHVYYDPNDPLSFVCAWLALLPQALCIIYVTLMWSSREVEVALMFVGQMGCEAVNFVLKRIIKEERPWQIHGKGYGMPSSHAQFVAYWGVFLSLFLLVRHQPPRTLQRNHQPYSFLERLAASLGAICIAAAVAWSRVYLNYHTPKQVAVGSLAGSLSAVAWFACTEIIRQVGLLDWVLQLPIARYLRVRDLLLREDISQAGWEKWEEKRVAAVQKKGK